MINDNIHKKCETSKLLSLVNECMKKNERKNILIGADTRRYNLFIQKYWTNKFQSLSSPISEFTWKLRNHRLYFRFYRDHVGKYDAAFVTFNAAVLLRLTASGFDFHCQSILLSPVRRPYWKFPLNEFSSVNIPRSFENNELIFPFS